MDAPKPILAVDVDGTVSLFGFDGPLDEMPGRFHLIDGVAHCIPDEIGPRLARLAERFDLVWATGWEERANDMLPAILGLPEALPVLTFGGRAQFGTSHWKLDALSAYAVGRPLAWVDDCIDENCELWAQQRAEPTLLVPCEPAVGITDAHVEAMLQWADEVSPAGSPTAGDLDL